MRKRLITPIPKDAPAPDEGWLDLDREAVVAVTSEEKEHPVESALVSGEMRGLACRRFWRSDHPAKLRPAAKTQSHLARLRRNRDRAYPRVRLAMVWGWRALVSRNCAPAVEFQSP